MKRLIPILLALSVVLPLFGCAKKPSDPQEGASEAAYRFTDAEGLAFTDLLAYSGPYLEDGSNEELQNVTAIRVANRSEQQIQYAEFTVASTAGDLHFTCTTLLPGKTMLLLEQNRTPFTGAAVNGVKTDNRLLFTDPPSLYPDTFSVSVSGHVMTLRNLSESPVPGNIYVYFKRVNGEGYVGGITYRVHFSDLAAGAEASMSSQNLSGSECEILFIGCENPPEVRS